MSVQGFQAVTIAADTPAESAAATAWEWAQTGGTTVTRLGSGASIAFLTPPLLHAEALTFTVRATISGQWTPLYTITVNVAAWPWWLTRTDGSLAPQALGAKPVVVNPDAPAEPAAASRVRVSRLQINSIGTIVEPPPAANETPTTGLFFKLPDDIRSKPKKMFPHYFPPYPLSLDNAAPANDYYKRNYLNPLGESSANADQAGLLRDRPFPTSPKPAATYVKDNARIEIEYAKAVGIDGFFVDMLGFTGNNWTRAMALRDAAIQWHPDFPIIPMIDGNGAHGAGANPPATIADPARVANTISLFANRPTAYIFEGKTLVGTYRADNANLSVSWWQQVKDLCLSNHGISIAYAHAVQSYASAGATFAPITDIASVWGIGSDPAIINASSNQATTARARGDKWMQPIQSQNIRPGMGWFDEACNTGAFRAAWAKAIRENADFIQYVTWSDFSEGGQVVPSIQNGRVLGDLGAYYMTWWKTGVKPTILRDAIYLSHRNQLTTATPQYASTSPMTQRAQTGRTTARNTIEVLSFFIAPATVTITNGANTATYTAPAGEYVNTVTMVNGSISVSAVRSGTTVASITSPIGCMASPPVQDFGYYRMGSLRPEDTAAMYVPSNLDGVTL